NQLTQKRLVLNPRLILRIHRQITKGLLPESQTGRWRKGPVQIFNPRTQQPIFLPPVWQEVSKLIDNLISFVNQKHGEVDPLILAGIFHKQFVIIHPFMDGNGRCTRLLTKVLLAYMGLNTFNLFSFESYYNQNVSKYFQKVGEVGDYEELTKQKKIDFTQWLEYFTDGIIDELLRVEKLLPQSAPTPASQLKPHHEAILNYLKTHKFITDQDYSKLVGRAKATRALDYNFLIDLKLIERKGKGKNTYYILKSP
ncbi:MAG: Fic family protein, partial [Patescibacteria group bacterium]